MSLFPSITALAEIERAIRAWPAEERWLAQMEQAITRSYDKMQAAAARGLRWTPAQQAQATQARTSLVHAGARVRAIQQAIIDATREGVRRGEIPSHVLTNAGLGLEISTLIIILVAIAVVGIVARLVAPTMYAMYLNHRSQKPIIQQQAIALERMVDATINEWEARVQQTPPGSPLPPLPTIPGLNQPTPPSGPGDEVAKAGQGILFAALGIGALFILPRLFARRRRAT